MRESADRLFYGRGVPNGGRQSYYSLIVT